MPSSRDRSRDRDSYHRHHRRRSSSRDRNTRRRRSRSYDRGDRRSHRSRRDSRSRSRDRRRHGRRDSPSRESRRRSRSSDRRHRESRHSGRETGETNETEGRYPQKDSSSTPAASSAESAPEDFVINITAAMMSDRLVEIINMPINPVRPQSKYNALKQCLPQGVEVRDFYSGATCSLSNKFLPSVESMFSSTPDLRIDVRKRIVMETDNSNHTFALDLALVKTMPSAAPTPAAMLLEVKDNSAVTLWASEALVMGLACNGDLASGSKLSPIPADDATVTADDEAAEDDVLICPAFQRAVDLMRGAGAKGGLIPHYNNYAKIETIG